MTMVTLQKMIDEWEDDPFTSNNYQQSAPPKKTLVFKQDPIACACASYRMWRENPARRWSDLDTVVVWQDDIEQAQALRKYYRERLVMSALKNHSGNTSEFRRKLGALVTDQLEITKEELGMLHRLPYFYAEDLDIDYVIEHTANTKKVTPHSTDTQLMTQTFFPLRKIFRSRRAAETNHYWWTTEPGGMPFELSVKTDNPLSGIIDSLFERPQADLQCYVKPQSFRGYYPDRWYYGLFGVRLP